MAFASFFGFDQTDIKGRSIAGADEHLIGALQKDNTAISYSNPSLIYDLEKRTPKADITIIPVDLDGNKKITEEEKIYANLDDLLNIIAEAKFKNLPEAPLYLYLKPENNSKHTLQFVQWILEKGIKDLNYFGFSANPYIDREKEKLKYFEVTKDFRE